VNDLFRQRVAGADTVVVKVGTRTLTLADGRLDPAQIGNLAQQLAALVAQGRRVALVSSGAVGAGIGRMQLTERPRDLAELQAVAAVGQSCLIEAYNRALEPLGHFAAQVLLTADDFVDRTRYLNVRNTLSALFRLGAIPVINENDTVRVDELQRNFGDNDRLAAMVTNLLRAPLLVLLTDVEGVLTADDPPQVVSHIDLTRDDGHDLIRSDNRGGVQLSRGGMASKLDAARIATNAGELVVIADGRRPNVLAEIVAGNDVGTLLAGGSESLSSRKRWIGWAARSQGAVVLDAGACRAVALRGGSLLAIGVVGVQGAFEKGDVVSLVDQSGHELARGLCNYDSESLAKIAGLATDRIAEVLGHAPYDEVVHRDHLALVDTRKSG
jgi:glutamate 5-kinase